MRRVFPSSSFALGASLLLAATMACRSNAPTAPTGADAGRGVSVGILQGSNGIQQTAISGTIELLAMDPTARVIMTPSGMCQMFGTEEHMYIDGDMKGPITFHAKDHTTCDFTHLTGDGPFDAEVTFEGRTGTMSGQWTTNCKFDPAIANLSCDGTMNGRGSGGLEGMQFHIKWGPGYSPWSFTGTMFSK